MNTSPNFVRGQVSYSHIHIDGNEALLCGRRISVYDMLSHDWPLDNWICPKCRKAYQKYALTLVSDFPSYSGTGDRAPAVVREASLLVIPNARRRRPPHLNNRGVQ
jgi:hypothetical protein